jgi:hypothetical protein
MSKKQRAQQKRKSFVDSNFANEVRLRAGQRRTEIEVAEEYVRKDSLTDGFGPTLLNLAFQQDVLSLNKTDPNDQLLRDVFVFCSLQPDNPWHWRILLEAITEVAFKKSGAHEKWNEASLFELQRDIQELQKHESLANNNSKIAAALKRSPQFKSKYKDFDTDYLRKLIGKARDPHFNPMIEYSNDEDFVGFLVRQRSARYGNSELVTSWIEKLIEQQIKESMAGMKEKYVREGLAWTSALHEELLPEVSRIVRANLSGKDE